MAVSDRPRLFRRTPSTFGEKIRFRMANDRRPVLQTFADKHAVRDFVARRAGSDLLPVLHHVTTDPATIDITRYPAEFVLKASHGCSGSIIVSRRADPDASLPPTSDGVGWSTFTIHPDSLGPVEHLRSIARDWLNLRYHPAGEHYEWAYQDITPRVLAEEYLEPTDPSLIAPRDIKFHCFDGRCEFIKHVSGRYTDDIRGDLMTRDWVHLDVEMTQRRSALPPARPRHLERMVEIAETLADGMDFVRVDLYEIGDRIVFGEMTNYPEAGTAVFRPRSYDKYLGGKWTYFQTPGRRFR